VTAAVLADFGSTFTKVTLVELQSGRLIARAQAPTSVESDVMIGYQAALDEALEETDGVELGPRLAASSAAGGLKVAAIGLVEDLTAAAGQQAALNAGARIELVLHGRLGEKDTAALAETHPEVILFCGGTDGGQEQIVLANAERVAAAEVDGHYVVACNSHITERVGGILGRSGSRVDVVDNVMPQIGSLEVEPARAAISEAFVHHVIQGKGLSQGTEFAREVVMPTPEAVLRATRLLAESVGDVVIVDIGGATTDVHSATQSSEQTPGIRGPLLPVLPVLRSVQGDLGLRSNAPSVLEADREWIVANATAREPEVVTAVLRRAREPEFVAVETADWAMDRALAVACVLHAVRRHCGRLTIRSSPNQPAQISTDGPDLRGAPLVVGTGGILVRAPSGEGILRTGIGRCDSRSLTPRSARYGIDASYVLAAAGLLADLDTGAATRLMRENIRGLE